MRLQYGRGTVYFVQAVDGGPIKIGFTTKDPAYRIRDVAAAEGVELHVLGTFEGYQFQEMMLHTFLRGLRLHVRGEWFKDCADVRAIIDIWCDDDPTEDALLLAGSHA